MSQQSAWRWWSTYGDEMPELQRLAMDILSLVGGACSCERSWSAFDFIHSKKRNRLSAEKCGELVYVFSNLRLLRKANSADAKELFYAWVKEDSNANKALQISESITSQGRQHYDESHSDTCSSTDEDSDGESGEESDEE